MLTTTIFSVLLGLISIGSSVAFNAVVSLPLASLYASYLLACSLLLWRRTTGCIRATASNDQLDDKLTNLPGSGGQLVWGPWRVKGFPGVLINVVACAYLLLIEIFVFWPPSKDVTAKTMNYSSLVLGAVAVLSAVYYLFWGRRTYHGPVVETCQ